MIFLLLSICCTIKHIAIFKVPGYAMKKKFYCRGNPYKHKYKSILEVSAACTREPDCKIFEDEYGKGKTFTLCSQYGKFTTLTSGGIEGPTGTSTILYVKGKLANFQAKV